MRDVSCIRAMTLVTKKKGILAAAAGGGGGGLIGMKCTGRTMYWIYVRHIHPGMWV